MKNLWQVMQYCRKKNLNLATYVKTLNNAVITAEYEKYLERLQGEKVTKLIRQKYTLNEELAILRQRDTKPTEFAKYNAYAEECKAKAKL